MVVREMRVLLWAVAWWPLLWAVAGLDTAGYSDGPRCVTLGCREPVVKAGTLFFKLPNRTDVYVKFKENQHFLVTCASPTSISVNDSDMPKFPKAMTFDKVSIAGCRTPPESYLAALAARNVAVIQTLELGLLPNDQAPVNLTGLTVTSLTLQSNDGKNNVNLTEPSIFKYLNESNLRKLSLVGVVTTSEYMSMFPYSLQELYLKVSFQKEPRSLDWLERLHSLTSLTFEAELGARLASPSLSKLPRLRAVSLRAPLDLLWNWLHGSAVTTLELRNCGLQKLPENMFSAVNLTELRLIGNNITELPNDVSSLKSLTLLDVSDNSLRGAGLWRAAAALGALDTLAAACNPLGAACPEDGGLSMPRGLRELRLSATGATRVCGAWRDLPALKTVDLSDNRIAAVAYAELKGAARGAVVDLRRNPLRAVAVGRAELAGCRREVDAGLGHADLRVSLSALRCDCASALFLELLERCAGALALAGRGPACAPSPSSPPTPSTPSSPPSPPPSFRRLRPDDLCACPAAYSVPWCSCHKRAADNATVFRCAGAVPRDAAWPAGAGPLALLAPGAGLTAVPAAPLLELYAANNSITTLRAEDISDTLMMLDVRNNSIASLSVAAVRRLRAAGRRGARARLAGNPLACACAQRDSLALLLAADLRVTIEDWEDLRCSDGREISALTPSDLCFNWPLFSLSIVGFVLILMSTLIVWRVSRTRIKQFLLERHLCLDWVLRPQDSACDPSMTRSAFISYAFEDRAIAVELIQRLEERGYSIVEHSRDWQPGVPVAQQITKSVECARRTILIVTDNYARSSWGLQEFREAHAHALARGSSRVILVLCGLSSPDILPEDLRLYLRNNTYLSWADADFWDKLWRIMPPEPPANASRAVTVAPSQCHSSREPGRDGGAEPVPLEPRAGP